jgi:hypothetical protein
LKFQEGNLAGQKEKTMNKWTLLCCSIILLILFAPNVHSSDNCIGCVVGARIIYQIMESQEPNAEKALKRVCRLLPDVLSHPCEIFISIEG